MEIHLKITGILFLMLAAMHTIFPKYFNWKSELSFLSLINRQMMYVHTFFLGLTILLMGLLCLVSSYDLIHTELGKTISLGFGIFWGIRFFFQFFVYSSSLWKGKPFETTVHIVFSFAWLYFAYVFLSIALT
jgi:hypothetical protein